MMRHLLSPTKLFGIGISSHAASPVRVVQRRVYLADQESFLPGSSGYLRSLRYEIFHHSKDDALPPNVYHGTLCGMSATIHFISKGRSSDVQKWLYLQNACHPGFVLSVKAVYTCFNGRSIVFTEPVSSTLFGWVARMRRDQMPLLDPATGYIIPKLRLIYRDILTSIMLVRNYTNEGCHGNVTLGDIWLRNGTTILGCPAYVEVSVSDTDMFEDLMDIIHHDVLPRDLEFFCRVLHNDVSVMLSLLEHSPFLKTHIEKMRYRFCAVREFFDSTNKKAKLAAAAHFGSIWNSYFANEVQCAVMWCGSLTWHNPITSSKSCPITHATLTYVVSFNVSNWMVDGHPIHYLICVRNGDEHGTHLKNEEWFDIIASSVWPDHLSMLSYIIAVILHTEAFSSFTRFPLKWYTSNVSNYPLKNRRQWKADQAKP